MALTSSLSCVDYLSIKFGCQSLNSEKEIYNHLSKEWFYGPLIEEFRFHGKQDSWNSIFRDASFTSENKLRAGRGCKNALHKRHKSRGIRNKGFSENIGLLRGQCSPETFSIDTETSKQKENDAIDLKNEENGEERQTDSFVSLQDIENDALLTSLEHDDDDDCQSESELELLQICRKENQVGVHSTSESMFASFSRKRSSTECLVESDNVAKRMRPSLDLNKMQNSRFFAAETTGRFIPILSPSSS